MLERLIGRELAARLERRPGQKEQRYLQAFAGEDGAALVGPAEEAEAPVDALAVAVTADQAGTRPARRGPPPGEDRLERVEPN